MKSRMICFNINGHQNNSHHFIDGGGVDEVLDGFKIDELFHVEREYEGMKNKGCHFVVIATKRN